MQYVNIHLFVCLVFFVEVQFLIVISLRWEREVKLKSNMWNAWMLG